MSETTAQGDRQDPQPDRIKTFVVVLTVFTTVVTAIVAGLQADANIRASASNRDSQLYAILAAGELHHQDMQSTYDLNVFADYLKDAQQATILQMTALQQEQSGDTKAAAASRQEADIAQARADTARNFSLFFNDTRYAPQNPGDLPNTQAYLTDLYAAANDLVAKQNAAADAYDRWNQKGDAYTSVLTILAIAFFLFGLAQALSSRRRFLFVIFGTVALSVAGVWTAILLFI
jgi:hypothetical protein